MKAYRLSEAETIEAAIGDLVIANRILGHENVMDASGHVSMRHPTRPDRYLLSRSRSPQLVSCKDIMEFTLDSEPVEGAGRSLYIERFIHGEVYKARSDVNAVVHAHAEDVLPFTIHAAPLRPVIGAASAMGKHIPKWDIREKFGDRTNLLVSRREHGEDLARRLGANAVALMRGHGFVAARPSLMAVVRLAIFMPRNARVQMNAMRMGGDFDALSEGEIEVKGQTYGGDADSMYRGWEYWAVRAGCAALLRPRADD